jgi:hypothetical protein
MTPIRKNATGRTMRVRSAGTNVRGHHEERAEDDTPIEIGRDTNLHIEIEVEAAHLTMELHRIEMLYLMESLWT